MGQGGGNHNPANNILLSAINDYQPLYLGLEDSQKRPFAKAVYQDLKGLGGRFEKLDKATGEYFQVPEDDAVESLMRKLRDDSTEESRAAKRCRYELTEEQKMKEKALTKMYYHKYFKKADLLFEIQQLDTEATDAESEALKAMSRADLIDVLYAFWEEFMILLV